MSAPEETRAAVLDRIRAALGVASLDHARRTAVARRLERHPRGTIPSRATRRGEERVALLTDMLTKQGADVSRVPTQKEAVGAIASYLGTCNLPPRLRMGADRVLAALPWREAWDIERSFGRAEPGDRASLSRAVVAAAETGTLFLVSGADNPTTLNFLPEAHTILIAASDIVGSYEEAWDRVRAIYGAGDAAPHRQPDQRAIKDGRYRADHRQRRPRPKPPPGADPRLDASRGNTPAFHAFQSSAHAHFRSRQASVMVQCTLPPRAKIGKSGSKTGSGWPSMRLAVWLIERPRWFKRALLIVNDLVLLSIAIWAAYTLRLSRLYVPPNLGQMAAPGRGPHHRRHRLLHCAGSTSSSPASSGRRAPPASISR